MDAPAGEFTSDGLTFSVQTTTTKGVLSCNTAGSCTYKADAGQSGQDLRHRGAGESHGRNGCEPLRPLDRETTWGWPRSRSPASMICLCRARSHLPMWRGGCFGS